MIIRTVPLLPHSSEINPEEELRRVMREISVALHGTSATLTLHPQDASAQLVYADCGIALSEVIIHALGAVPQLDAINFDQHIWITGDFDPYAAHALVLPVRQVPGHSRLLITVLFTTVDAERRAAAEAIYLERRPFAVGYFRLWQQQRLAERETAALRGALDRVKVAVMLIDKTGRIAFSNEAGRKLLHRGDGIREQHGEMLAANRADSIVLRVSIAHVLEASTGGGKLEAVPLFTIKRPENAGLIVAVLPVPYEVVEPGDVAAMVIVVDPDVDIREYASAVCRVFGLSRMETELACELASGMTIQQAAARLRIKEETGRGYLRTIFAKTGAKRQADLVRIILISLVRI